MQLRDPSCVEDLLRGSRSRAPRSTGRRGVDKHAQAWQGGGCEPSVGASPPHRVVLGDLPVV